MPRGHRRQDAPEGCAGGAALEVRRSRPTGGRLGPGRELGKWSRSTAPVQTPPDEALSVLTPYPADPMETWPVSTVVNRAGYDTARMVEPTAT